MFLGSLFLLSSATTSRWFNCRDSVRFRCRFFSFSILAAIRAFTSDPGASSEELLERVWDEHADPFTTVVRVTIGTLRKELGDPPLIHTVIGKGYRI